ncbi:cell growth-regulating nucleolar protein-like [Ornithodoros turicata]|uniref:cell growth-regulating nucleolar protein-like n=1 Tax=Ornithodoros turicata TaxID=34597 RepID=UPI003138F7EA
MVTFTCSSCGESVKKNQVEKHYLSRCRSCNMLTCIDCNKDFWGDDYKLHTKCVTEQQRYGGKDFKAPTAKGEAKQQEWMDLIANVIATENVPPRVRSMFKAMEAYENVPRKMKPFKNFLASSLRIHDQRLAEEAWQIIQQAQAQKSQNEQPPKRRAEAEPPQSPKRLCENGTSVEDHSENQPRFKWKKAVKATLRSAKGQQLSWKKLQKKVFAQYHASSVTPPMTDEEMRAKFQKVVTGHKQIEQDGDVVRLVPVAE